jgi:hypothetical protein
MDIVGPLPESNRYDALFVVVDYHSKAVKLELITIEATAQDIAKVLRQRVFRDHGLPKVMVHDCDTKFISQWATELYRLLSIKQNPSTVYHPQTDGQTKRVNQEIEKYLWAFIDYQQDDWTEWLDLPEFAYNDHAHSTTQQSPFYVMHGQHPWKGDPTPKDTKVQDVEERIVKLKEICKTAEEAWEHSKKLGKATNDRRSRRVFKFQPGQQVYLAATNIKTDRPSKKLDDKCYGPFKVLKEIGQAAYLLDLPKTWKAIHPVIHEEYLTLYHPPSFEIQRPPPPPPAVVVEGHIEHDVETILDLQTNHKRVQYLVKWTGYPREEATWESWGNVKNSPNLIKEFHA